MTTPVAFVGLTGGLGAGKSTALASLSRLGAATLSTDAVVHQLYETDAVRDAVRDRWGTGVFDGERVNRQAIARLAFGGENDDDREREWLERLLWPLVGERVAEFRASVLAREISPGAAVVEVPLLFEAGNDSNYDATIAVVADDALRAVRVSARDHAELARREIRQLSQQEKSERATFTVVNDGTLEELDAALASVLAALRR